MGCPSCGSERLWKAGFYRNRQRRLCRNCLKRFSESEVDVDVMGKSFGAAFNSRPKLLKGRVVSRQFSAEELFDSLSLSSGEDVVSHRLTTVGKDLNAFPYSSSKRRLRASEREVKKLTGVVAVKDGASAEPTEKLTETNIKSDLVNFAWWMKKQGYKESTIKVTTANLTQLLKNGAKLFDPESVRECLARQEKWSLGYKLNVAETYATFVRKHGLKWEKPRFKPVEKFPFIPTEKEIDELVAGTGEKLSCYIQLLKETGIRSGEADLLTWVNLDIERKVITVAPLKGSKPRIFRLSPKSIAKLQNLPRTSKRIFGNLSPNSMRTALHHARKRLARKLNNPRLEQIHFHTLRHWKATMLYHETKDILYVKEFLGHRRIDNTLKYVQLEQALFQEDAESFSSRVAKTQSEICQLIEAGFEYVTQKDGLVYFRKRK